jgi:succinate-acetate transporter protein
VEATTPPGGGARQGAVGGESGSLAAQAPAKVSEVIADPAPLGLAAFALTTFVLSMFNSGLVSEKGEPVVLGLALAYGGLAQLLAGMWEFKNNNTFGATAFTSFGAFWLSFWAFNQFFAKEITGKADLGHAVGLYLIGWGIFTAYMWIASFRVSVAVSVVFFLLAITFIVLGIGNSGADESIVKAGGYIGLATAVAAWYASFATVTNKTFGRIVMPVKELRR